jgi:hypothetical protein
MVDITQNVLHRLKASSPGTVFVLKAFEDLGNHDAVGRALRCLTKAGKITRVCRGVYDIPRDHPTLGQLSPVPNAVERAIAAQAGTACSQLLLTRQTCLVSHHRYSRRSSIWLMAVLEKLLSTIRLSISGTLVQGLCWGQGPLPVSPYRRFVRSGQTNLQQALSSGFEGLCRPTQRVV